MDKYRRRELIRQSKAQLLKKSYSLNEGGMPRMTQIVGLPQAASDQEYLETIKSIGAQVLYPLEDAPRMELHDRGPEGESLLHLACGWGDLRSVRLLVAAGIDIELKEQMDQTPLHIAVGGRYLDIVKFLVTCGANPNVKDAFGYSPLEWSLEMGYTEITDVLQR